MSIKKWINVYSFFDRTHLQHKRLKFGDVIMTEIFFL